MAINTDFKVGTASWTDPTLVKTDLFYPKSLKTAEERLRFYASHFNTVEVDSSYYTLLGESTSAALVARTPPSFIFNIKAFAMLTQHPAEVARLPIALKELLSEKEKSQQRIARPSPQLLDLAFGMFWSSLAPLRQAAKLGVLLFQFPPYFVRKSANFAYLEALRERLPQAALAIEFRHPSWVVEGQARRETMEFLRRNQMCYVSVDCPQGPSIVPSFLQATTSEIYFRFHGRNRETWFKKGITAAERFKYLYAERELEEQAERLRAVDGVKRAYV
ncbi:MAG TPA: DUF72 domain-containing protein, partial [Candidatus Binataceae bacterium]